MAKYGKTTVAVFGAVALWLGCSARSAAQQAAVPERLEATINTQQTAAPVTKYEWGQFIEHIGNTMYSSLWAEMLDDRKFYFPINSVEPKENPRAGAGPFRMRTRKWYPVGPDDVVAMDTKQPFVGDQSPRITLDGSTPHGIRQAGLALVKGKKYTGRIYLRGTPGTRVNVALIWGPGKADRQTIALPALSQEYRKFPLAFTAGTDSTDATIEISGTGTGSYHIGTLSLMPADNVDGFRPDTTSVLRQIKTGFWRYGGNYTSGLIWYHIVGDIDKRPPDFDHAWNAMQTNDLGLDEFMTLCRLIDVEPYISVDAGFGDSHSAAEEVEYMNGSTHTRLGAERAKNGHPEPYHVKFWNIGNEPWGSWQLGRTDMKYFMMKHNEFAKAMRAVDPSITLIASGLMLQNDNVPGPLRSKYVGNLDGLYGSDSDWDGGFLKDTWGNFDILAEHWYARGGHHWDIEKGKLLGPDAPSDNAYTNVNMSLLESVRYPADTVRLKAEEFEGYQKRFPIMVEKKIPLSIDEYAYFNIVPGSQNPFGGMTLRQALAYGMILNEMMRYTDFLTMAAQTTGASLIDFNRTSAKINALGLLYKMYSEEFTGAIPVEVSGNSPQPAPKYPAGSPDQPEKPSGSPTYPLDVLAALSPDHRTLIVSVVNATETEQKLDLHLQGSQLKGPAALLKLTGSSPAAVNHVGQPEQVHVEKITLGDASGTIAVAPISVNVYRFPVQ